MSIKIAICKEQADNENRVAATPETIKKMVTAGLSLAVQSGAGMASSYTDDAYKQAGAQIHATAAKTVKGAQILLSVQTPQDNVLKALDKNTAVIGALNPHMFGKDKQKSFKENGLSAMAMELMPRITRAQSMDILSSQSNLTGYRAVIDAAHEFGRAFPMMMTAAGTVSPARVFVMGAGVAGLQAVATARRLGAIVSGTDVRLAAKEQVESLGATFVMVENEETKASETEGGYAKEMSASYKKAQAKLIADTIAKQDIVITTALIPGRPAPELVTEDMVKSMKAGSVIVDLATSQGGNCALSQAGKIVEKYDVKIIGFDNMASRIAVDASALYARNLWTFVQTILSEDKKSLTLNLDDEILKAITLMHDGKVVHDMLGAPAPKKAAVKKPAAKKAATSKTATKAVKKKTTPKTASKPVAKKDTKTAPKKTAVKKAPTKKAGKLAKMTTKATSKSALKNTAKTATKGAIKPKADKAVKAPAKTNDVKK